ncbi:MAG: YXWGXW repeat-containing protein [Verrucomicrobia bacterium]|nr:YXWGXW repeat-containing protein [Verrucomicrobiota bacterium]MDE3097996.1 YXWGXW repeat-containing protein [Verrucomicrobiota bacterium]
MIVAVGLPLLAGCVTRTVYRPARGQTVVVTTRTEPPPARIEVRPPSPGIEYVWIAGAWSWRGGNWVWVPGRWTWGRPGVHWVPGHWRHRPGGWVWVEGHWR